MSPWMTRNRRWSAWSAALLAIAACAAPPGQPLPGEASEVAWSDVPPVTPQTAPPPGEADPVADPVVDLPRGEADGPARPSVRLPALRIPRVPPPGEQAPPRTPLPPAIFGAQGGAPTEPAFGQDDSTGCVPDCEGKECGPSGCSSQSCGQCAPGEACVGGQCGCAVGSYVLEAAGDDELRAVSQLHRDAGEGYEKPVCAAGVTGPPGDRDGWALLGAPDGTIAWEAVGGGLADDAFDAVVAWPDGGCVAVGHRGDGVSGSNDGWVVSYDRLGQVQWERTVGTDRDERLYGAARPSIGGGVWVVGGSRHAGSLGWEYWLVVLDDAGEVTVERTFGGAGDQVALGVDAVGWTYGGVLGGLSAAAGQPWDGALVRLDAAGLPVWTRAAGGPGVDAVRAVRLTQPTVDTPRRVVAVGERRGPGGDTDVWLWAADPATGDTVWEGLHGGPGDQQGRALALGGDGRLVVVGTTAGLGGASDGTDAWIGAFTGDGELEQERVLGGPGYDALRGVAGVTALITAVGVTPSASGGGSAGWLLRLSQAGTASCGCGDGTCDGQALEDCASCPEDCPCAPGQQCTPQGTCCLPSCAGTTCGDDGCGGTCGVCGAGQVCDGGSCACGRGERALGGGGDEELHAIAAGAGGSLCVAGALAGGGVGDRAWVAHVDADGALDWDARPGSPGGSLHAVVASGGGCVAAGRRAKGGRASDAWVVAVDSGGVGWQVALGGPGDERAAGIVARPGGQAVVGTGPGVGGGDLRLWLLGAGGAVEGDRPVEALGDQRGTAITPLADGWAIGGLSAAPGAPWAARVVRVTADGEPLWTWTSGLSASAVRALLPADGEVIAVGERVTPGGDADAWVARLTADGELVGEWTAGGPGQQGASAALLDPAGVTLLGWDRPEGSADTDGWVALLAGGDLTFAKRLGGAGYDAVRGAARLPGGDAVLAGVTQGQGRDGWLVRLAPGWHASCACGDGTCDGGALEGCATCAGDCPCDGLACGPTDTCCEPVCAGECGDDGCGGACGACAPGTSCVGGACACDVRRDALPGATDVRSVAGAPGGGACLAGVTGAAGWLARLDASGALAWELTPGDGELAAVVALDDGGCLAAGVSGARGWAVRANATGGLSWSELYGEGASAFRAAAQDGATLLGGARSGAGTQGWDAWVVQVDGAGAVIGEQTLVLPGDQLPTAMAPAGEAVLLAGLTATTSLWDAWAVAVDPSGGTLWQATWGGGDGDEARAIVAHPDGGAWVAGRTTGIGVASVGWVARVGPGGQALVTYAEPGGGALHGLTLRDDGSLLAVGERQLGAAPLGWLVTLGPDGGMLTSRTAGPGALRAVAPTPAGGTPPGGALAVGASGGIGAVLRLDPAGHASCACGDGACDGATLEDCTSCPADCGCAGCGPDGTCCEPSCAGKECGDDGCGGQCPPGCGTGLTCVDGACEAGEDTCVAMVLCVTACGPAVSQPCYEACASQYPSGAIGYQALTQCFFATCGSSPDSPCIAAACEGPCAPECAACTPGGCTPSCAGKVCGDDGCGGPCPPGCSTGKVCLAGQCVCQDSCTPGATSCAGGQPIACVETPGGCTMWTPSGPPCPWGCGPEGGCCTPDCAGRECGSNGCPVGDCGACPPDLVCTDGACGCPGACTPGEVRCWDSGRFLCTVAGGQCPAFVLQELCPAGCDPVSAACCAPACGASECGPSQCPVGDCGTCEAGLWCSGGSCSNCTPACEGRACGDDGCGGSCGSCSSVTVCSGGACTGSCPDVFACTSTCLDGDVACAMTCANQGSPKGKATFQALVLCAVGVCGSVPSKACLLSTTMGACASQYADCTAQCAPACAGRQCGSDGCGGSCGSCALGAPCEDGVCGTCTPACAEKACGPDGCGGSCGSCPGALGCSPEGTCVDCTCEGKTCGLDACGAICGACPPGTSCSDGACGPCSPQCDGKQCGPDGCGGVCGTCPPGGWCASGTCQFGG